MACRLVTVVAATFRRSMAIRTLTLAIEIDAIVPQKGGETISEPSINRAPVVAVKALGQAIL